MKFALGFLTCCLLVVIATVVFAPEYSHEIIDWLHGNSDSAGKIYVVTGDNSEGGEIASDEKSIEIEIETSEPTVRYSRLVPGREPSSPRNEREMLDWLKARNYDVAHEQGFYRISWQMQKPTSSKPTSIIIRKDGKVVPQYEHIVVNRGGGAVSIGGRATVTTNGITTTAFAKYESGSWWIETTRSFYWSPGQDSIENVLSKAKKMKEVNDEN